MKNFKFLPLLLLVFIFATVSCDMEIPEQVDLQPIPAGNLPAELLQLNKVYSKTIQVKDQFFFIAGRGTHTLSLTNCTLGMAMPLFGWDGTLTMEDLVAKGPMSGYYVDWLGVIPGGIEDPLIVETLVPEATYLIEVGILLPIGPQGMDTPEIATCDILISND